MALDGNFPPYKAVPLATLVPYARNTRTHTDAQVSQIAASIREFGFTNPVLVDGERGVIAGHGRLLAARKLGMTEIPTIKLSHLTPAQKRAYVLADNRLALSAGWDEDMLRIELGELHAEGFDLGLTGFDPGEIASFLIDHTGGLTDPDGVPELPANPVIHTTGLSARDHDRDPASAFYDNGLGKGQAKRNLSKSQAARLRGMYYAQTA
jgi:ParB-like chromosome segregation protein Spo0J